VLDPVQAVLGRDEKERTSLLHVVAASMSLNSGILDQRYGRVVSLRCVREDVHAWHGEHKGVVRIVLVIVYDGAIRVAHNNPVMRLKATYLKLINRSVLLLRMRSTPAVLKVGHLESC